MQDQRKKRREIFDEMTRKLILDAALGILIEVGLEGFTMDRVAQDAGVAKGTLYLHFKDKDNILEETIDKGFEPFFNLAETILGGDLSPEEKLEEFTLQGSLFFEQHRQFFTIAMRSRETKRIHQMDADSPYWNLVDKIARVLEDGIRQGMFKPVNTTNVAGMFLDSNGALIIQHLAGRSTNTARDNVKLIMDVFLNGIRT
jgi:AcrR family transcriptional regulator